jgi:hypothetical protein
VFQRDNVSIEAGDADGPSLGATESGGAEAALTSVNGISRCSVETGSGAGGASGMTAECEGSGGDVSGTSSTGCSSTKDGNDTSSDSRAGSTGSDRGATGRPTLKELGTSLEGIDGSSGCEGSSKRRTSIGCGRSDAPIASDSTIDPLASLKIEECADGNGSGLLNETGSSEVDVLDGERSGGSGTDSG